MSRKPAWVDKREAGDGFTELVTDPVDIALGSAQIAQKAAKKVVDVLPTPDPRDDVNYQRLAGLEQGVLARFAPRRNRWPELQAFDDRLVEVDMRESELLQEIAELNGRRQDADPRHAAALAGWFAGGQEGPKPDPDAAELDARIADVQAELAAQGVLREKILGERIAFVSKQRESLVRTAEEETSSACERYLRLVDDLEQARDELVELNESRIWAQLYPSELLRTYPPSHELVGGLRQPTERHLPFVPQGLPAHAVFAVLREDAEHFAQVSTRDQAAAAKGVTRAELAGDEAFWGGSDADKAWQQREKQRLREEHERVWGVKPAEYSG